MLSRISNAESSELSPIVITMRLDDQLSVTTICMENVKVRKNVLRLESSWD